MVALVKGKQVTRQALADVFGVSLPTIDAWVRKGCPFVEKGGQRPRVFRHLGKILKCGLCLYHAYSYYGFLVCFYI